MKGVAHFSDCEWCSKEKSKNGFYTETNNSFYRGPGWCSPKCEAEWKAHHKDNLQSSLDELAQRQEQHRKDAEENEQYMNEVNARCRAEHAEWMEASRIEREKKDTSEAIVIALACLIFFGGLAAFPIWFLLSRG